MPDVSIVILNYNTRQRVLDCLASLRAAGIPSAATEVFVVDNASADGSADAVAAAFPQVELIRAPRNGGFAYGNNLALRRIRGRYALLLNPDTLVPPGAVAA